MKSHIYLNLPIVKGAVLLSPLLELGESTFDFRGREHKKWRDTTPGLGFDLVGLGHSLLISHPHCSFFSHPGGQQTAAPQHDEP